MTPQDAPKNNISKTVKCRELYGANNQTSPMHVKLCMELARYIFGAWFSAKICQVHPRAWRKILPNISTPNCAQ